MPSPAKELIEILKPAYKPCKFFDDCPQARWKPEKGHIPRGYLGATGKISEVEVVFVIAEPARPLEVYPKIADPLTYITASTDLAYEMIDHNFFNNLGHQNIKYVLYMLWPKLTFNEQLKKVWITESRLCSIDKPTGDVSTVGRFICSGHYLKKQLDLLSHAEIIGFGGKAHRMLKKLNIEFYKARALFLPEGGKSKARKNWKRIVSEIKNK